jgi:hypothetical protein
VLHDDAEWPPCPPTSTKDGGGLGGCSTIDKSFGQKSLKTSLDAPIRRPE